LLLIQASRRAAIIAVIHISSWSINKSMQRFIFTIILGSLVSAGCASAGPISSTDSPTLPAEQSTPVESPAANPDAPVATPTQVDGSQPFVEYQSGPLWVHLYSPMDGDVVQSPHVTLSGQAPAGTVISLNETIYIVPDDQSIMIPINLEEGPNLLELVASDVSGNEVSVVLTLTYEP
jgi:hypothetical protein